MNRSLVHIPLASLAIAAGLCLGPSAMAADCAAPALVNSLPLEQVPGSDTMTVPATIEGQPAKLLVGTADATQLWDGAAHKLNLPVEEGPRLMDGGGRFSENGSRVERLILGSMETGGFHLHVSADPEFANPVSAGVLGTDMMMRYDIDLDFAHHRLNYFTPEQCQGAGVYWAPKKLGSARMAAYATVAYVPVTLDGHTIIAALDTTASKSFLNPRVAQRLFGLSADPKDTRTIRESGAVLKAGLHKFSSLTLAGLTFDNPEIAIPLDSLTENTHEFHAAKAARDVFHLSEFLPDMVIGMDVLGKTHLYISFQDRRVYVSPAGDGKALTPEPLAVKWFNVWRFGYDMYWRNHHPFVAL